MTFWRTQARLIFVIFFAVPVLSSAVLAEDSDPSATLTIEQREEKRLLFNQYVEQETARREREKYAAARAPQKPQKIWVAKFSALYGYDSNVNYNSSRRGGGFFQETLSGSFKTPRPDLPGIPWSGKVGFSGYLDFFNYENFERSSYQTTQMSFFTEEQLSERLQLRLAYELSALRYPENDQLTYLGHRLKPTLTFFTSQTTAVGIFVSHEWRDYRDRKKIDASNAASDEGRVDQYAELGINPKFYPDPNTYFSLTLALKDNDSNDNYLNYSDYSGWKASALLYRKIRGPLSVLLIGGYDFKQYDALTFSTFENGPFETQADHLYYGGFYVYYDFNERWQAAASYLYKQGESNNPLLDWSGYTTNLGLNLTF